jgi:Zn-dependent protease
MAIITFKEIIDLLIMTFSLGFIFSNLFSKLRQRAQGYDPLSFYRDNRFLHDILFAAAIVAPGIILHEFGHKFVAMLFGHSAVFHASIPGLLVGVTLRLIGFPFIIFAPGYVSISGAMVGWQSSLIAFAGPAVNLAFWFVFRFLYKREQNDSKRLIFHAISSINLFLFIFNMLPFPPFDGFKVFSGLFSLF